jgi:hypothetical protein
MEGKNDQTKLSRQIRTLPERLNAERPTMRDILIALDDRAVAMILLVFSIPAIVPTPGIPVGMLFGSVLSFIGIQMVLGINRIRLPSGLSSLRIGSTQLQRAVDRVVPHLEKLERRLHPRICSLSTPLALRGIGMVVVIMAILIALPIPFGNTLPGVAVLLLAVGLSQRDGLFMLAGFGCAILAAATSWLLISGSWWLLESYFGSTSR